MPITFQEGQTEEIVKYCLEGVWNVEITFSFTDPRATKAFEDVLKPLCLHES